MLYSPVSTTEIQLIVIFVSVPPVLINDSQENLSAFLHRGLLYTERRQWQQAVFDFEAVIKLDR